MKQQAEHFFGDVEFFDIRNGEDIIRIAIIERGRKTGETRVARLNDQGCGIYGRLKHVTVRDGKVISWG